MRLYISKQEGLLIQGILLEELQKALDLSLKDMFKLGVSGRIYTLETLIGRIEGCLLKQKTGYNRKER